MEVILVDSYGHLVRSFQTWSEANKFRITRNRPDYRMTYIVVFIILIFIWTAIEEK